MPASINSANTLKPLPAIMCKKPKETQWVRPQL